MKSYDKSSNKNVLTAESNKNPMPPVPGSFDQNGPAKAAMAFIPARGGSKEIPRKNLAELGGKPLIAHSILAARRCKQIERVFVSTDCKEIAEVAKQWGAEVPFLRPPVLAKDKSLVSEAIDHALQEFYVREEYIPKAVVILFPTHPFRTCRLMDELTSILLSGYRVVRTVKPLLVNCFSHFTCSNGRLFSLAGNKQSDEVLYRSYGLYTGIQRLTNPPKNIYTRQIDDSFELIDIDTLEDLDAANSLWNKRIFKAGGEAWD